MNVTEPKIAGIFCRGRAAVTLALVVTLLVSSGMSQDDPGKAADDANAKPAAAKELPLITETELNNLTDELVMLAIGDELRRSEAVDGHRIDVDVDDGIVTLSGHVPHLLAKEIAVGLAQRVRGVVAVLDEI